METRQINLPIPETLYQRAKQAAANVPTFFKSWVASAIREKVQRDERKAAK